MSRRLVVLVAPDSFKGSFSSVEVAAAFARGWRAVRPADELRLAPLADGGEGTIAAIEAAGGWERHHAPVRDPLGRPRSAAWLRAADGRAVIEMAEAAGLSLVAPAERDPLGATSAGLGDLLLAAARAGARELLVGIGGSASTDGGRGLVEALGGLGSLDPLLGELRVRVACDVTSPLLGPRGAAHVYAPQKGASPADVAHLEARLEAWADHLEGATGRRVREAPGAGAAGGVGFALLALADHFGGFALEPGVELVMDATRFRERLAGAHLVLTGEGRIDAQTAFGKTVAGVARLARDAGVRCVALGGGVEPAGATAVAALGAIAIPVGPGRGTLSEAIAAGTAPLERAAAGVAETMGDG